MAKIDFTEIRPNTHRTTPEERLVAFLTKDFRRQHPDREDLHLELLAKDLAQEFTMIAGAYDIEDYSLTLRRPHSTTPNLDQLSDRN